MAGMNSPVSSEAMEGNRPKLSTNKVGTIPAFDPSCVTQSSSDRTPQGWKVGTQCARLDGGKVFMNFSRSTSRGSKSAPPMSLWLPQGAS